MFISKALEDGTQGGPAGIEALYGPSLFVSRRSSWFLFSDLWDEGPVKALEAWSHCVGQLLPQTEVIL